MSTVQIAGQHVEAEVTGYRLDTHSDPMESNYIISYSFRVGDKVYTGSTQRNRSYNIAQLPDTGSVLTVRYLPGHPGFNAEAGTPLMGMLVLGAGMVLIYLRLKKGKSR